MFPNGPYSCHRNVSILSWDEGHYCIGLPDTFLLHHGQCSRSSWGNLLSSCCACLAKNSILLASAPPEPHVSSILRFLPVVLATMTSNKCSINGGSEWQTVEAGRDTNDPRGNTSVHAASHIVLILVLYSSFICNFPSFKMKQVSSRTTLILGQTDSDSKKVISGPKVAGGGRGHRQGPVISSSTR